MNYKKLITSIYTYMAVLVAASIMPACTPDEIEDGLGPAPQSDMVKFTATPTTDNKNIITFTNETPGAFKAIWDFGNGNGAEGNQVNGAFPTAGTYTVKLTVFTKGGYTSNTKTVTIEQTNYSMLDREDYNFLSGGASDADGKTWVFDKEMKGHLGVGDASLSPPTPNWWAAGANDKAGVGLYDDEMTFKLQGFAYTYQNNGTTYSNKDYASELGGTNASEDVTVNYTPPANQTWSITEENGKKYLTLSNKGFMGYYVGESRYQILSLSENELYLMSSQKGAPGNAWFYRFIQKGYTRPTVPTPVKMEDMYDNFDEDGNIVWKKETLTLNESYDNPAPIGINKSAKVAQYVKNDGQPFEFANMYADFNYNFDLSQRSVFKIKAFVPSYNDFTTAAGEDWAIKNLLKQVSIKLQDGTSAQPWVNQVEIKQQVNQLDQWVELTFDFSAFAERKDLNRIVIQVGGEGNFIPGIFFLDDFRLEQ